LSDEMPSLNPDILEEIIPFFNQRKMTLENGSKALKNFMLSGKEPFEAVMKYFSRIDIISINAFTIRFYIKRYVLSKEYDNNLHKFAFDFPFLDHILEASVNVKLEIKAYPETFAGKKILARLTRRELKNISLDGVEDLPLDYFKFYKNECYFDRIHLNQCDNKKLVLSEFFNFPTTHLSITTHFQNFLDNIPNGSFFPGIEELSFIPCFCEEEFPQYSWNEKLPFSFTEENILKFIIFISESLPNLKVIKALFSASLPSNVWDWPEFGWEEICKNREFFDYQTFNRLRGKQLKGSIDFHARYGLNIGKKSIQTKIDIHEGLIFNFIHKFPWKESYSDYDEILEEKNLTEETEDNSVT
jgi:hypothetical protein